jgi:sugar phosphate isomerase/epimerase
MAFRQNPRTAKNVSHRYEVISSFGSQHHQFCPLPVEKVNARGKLTPHLQAVFHQNRFTSHRRSEMNSSFFSRREFLQTTSAAAAVIGAGTDALYEASAAPRRTYGIAWTSFPIRIRQAVQRQPEKRPPVPADDFITLCASFGASGCQMAFSQLSSHDTDYLKSLRQLLEKNRMFLELAVDTKTLGDADAMSKVAAAAQELNVKHLRAAMLSGRRYEDFHSMEKWQEFASQSLQTLERAVPLLEKHKLVAGLENHKDWTADEQVALLRRFSSAHLGACVDFGNNMSLLEDSLEVAQKLAPYVVNTHLKDMAVSRYEQGFLLSEVPLGEGITPLKQIISVLRKARPDVRFCLEMITRDPLKVPYLTDDYWATHKQRDKSRVEKFEKAFLSQTPAKPLPVISNLSSEQMLDAENENLRRCSAYATQKLRL